MDIASEIERLEELRRTGVLSDEEFQQAKENVLAGDSVKAGASNAPGKIQGMGENTWCMLMHLSQLLIYAAGIGIVVPVVMWVISKDESDLARRHGARMMNWMISSLIYALVSTILIFFLIGIPMAIAVLVMSTIFPVIAAIKANEGQLWSYPLTIRFIYEE